jgi:hypothetical protein
MPCHATSTVLRCIFLFDKYNPPISEYPEKAAAMGFGFAKLKPLGDRLNFISVHCE